MSAYRPPSWNLLPRAAVPSKPLESQPSASEFTALNVRMKRGWQITQPRLGFGSAVTRVTTSQAHCSELVTWLHPAAKASGKHGTCVLRRGEDPLYWWALPALQPRLPEAFLSPCSTPRAFSGSLYESSGGPQLPRSPSSAGELPSLISAQLPTSSTWTPVPPRLCHVPCPLLNALYPQITMSCPRPAVTR